MVVVTIVGVLAAMAIAVFGRVQRRTRNTRFAVDLRTFEQAFELYASQNGGWPPGASGGALPTGMGDYLNEPSWRTHNTLDGSWNWEQGTSGVVAAISTSGVAANDSQMREIDATVDDGNLSTGRFRKVGGRYLLILEE